MRRHILCTQRPNQNMGWGCKDFTTLANFPCNVVLSEANISPLVAPDEFRLLNYSTLAILCDLFGMGENMSLLRVVGDL